jgi:hypothetical protein
MCVVDATALCPSRYASIRTVSESTLLCGSVHRMRSVFSSQKRCYLLSGLSSLRMDQVRLAQSPLEIRSAFGRVQPWLCATLGSPGRCSAIFTSSSLGLTHRLCSSCLLLLLAPMRVVERVVYLSRNPQAVQEHR